MQAGTRPSSTDPPGLGERPVLQGTQVKKPSARIIHPFSEMQSHRFAHSGTKRLTLPAARKFQEPHRELIQRFCHTLLDFGPVFAQTMQA